MAPPNKRSWWWHLLWIVPLLLLAPVPAVLEHVNLEVLDQGLHGFDMLGRDYHVIESEQGRGLRKNLLE